MKKRNTLKKLLSVLLSSGVLLSASSALAEVYFAEPLQPHVLGGLVDVKEPEIISVDEEAYYLPPDKPSVISDEEEQAPPSKYLSEDKSYVTPPKNQGSLGVCWSFAATAAMESGMIKKGLSTANNTDYSEYHLAYFTHKRNELTGDGDDKKKNGSYFVGGNYLYAAQSLAGWQGAELESNYPYSDTVGAMPGIPEEKRYSSYAHLQDYYRLEAVDDVKRAVMEYGGVAMSYRHDNSSFDSQGAVYYNAADTGDGHAVFIVGWDDNYAADNFSVLGKTPSKPGAWRIKNSWGTESGDGGYFWMSYETVSIQNFVAFNVESANNYQLIHQYDGAYFNVGYNYPGAANIFTTDRVQAVSAVGFNTYHNDTVQDVYYKTEVYKLRENPESPTDGELKSSAEGKIKYDGYHTVPLDTPVNLAAGDKFSVVVYLTEADGSPAIQCYEGKSTKDKDGNVITLNYSSNAGESWVLSNNNWYDCTDALNNVYIKAYSVVDDVTVHFETNGAPSVSDMTIVRGNLLENAPTPTQTGKYFAGWHYDSALTRLFTPSSDTVSENTTLYAKWSDTPIALTDITLSAKDNRVPQGGTLPLSIAVSPYYADAENISFTSSDSSVLTVSDSGTVTGVAIGTATVTATATVGNAQDTISLSVYDSPGDVQLATTKGVFKTTENPEFSFYSENAASFNLYIIKNGRGYNISVNELQKNPYDFFVNVTLSEGEWEYYAEAFDSFGNSKTSKKGVFMVCDDNVLTVKKVAENQFVAFGYNADTEGTIAAAYYGADDRLMSVRTLPNNSDNGTLPTFSDAPAGYKTVKFMWWGSTDKMTPNTAAAVLGSSYTVGKTTFQK